VCADGARLCAVLPRVYADGARLCAVLPRVCADGARLCAVLPRVYADGRQLCAVLPRVCADGRQLCAVLPRVWAARPRLCAVVSRSRSTSVRPGDAGHQPRRRRLPCGCGRRDLGADARRPATRRGQRAARISPILRARRQLHASSAKPWRPHPAVAAPVRRAIASRLRRPTDRPPPGRRGACVQRCRARPAAPPPRLALHLPELRSVGRSARARLMAAASVSIDPGALEDMKLMARVRRGARRGGAGRAFATGARRKGRAAARRARPLRRIAPRPEGRLKLVARSPTP
jgi:hypothetical protein